MTRPILFALAGAVAILALTLLPIALSSLLDLMVVQIGETATLGIAVAVLVACGAALGYRLGMLLVPPWERKRKEPDA